MSYKKVKERIERKEEAVKNLIEYLAKENDYSSMMTELAIAQSSAMKLAEIARIHGDNGSIQINKSVMVMKNVYSSCM